MKKSITGYSFPDKIELEDLRMLFKMMHDNDISLEITGKNYETLKRAAILYEVNITGFLGVVKEQKFSKLYGPISNQMNLVDQLVHALAFANENGMKQVVYGAPMTREKNHDVLATSNKPVSIFELIENVRVDRHIETELLIEPLNVGFNDELRNFESAANFIKFNHLNNGLVLDTGQMIVNDEFYEPEYIMHNANRVHYSTSKLLHLTSKDISDEEKQTLNFIWSQIEKATELNPDLIVSYEAQSQKTKEAVESIKQFIEM